MVKSRLKNQKTPSGKSKYKPESSDVFRIAQETCERPLDIELKSKITFENEKD